MNATNLLKKLLAVLAFTLPLACHAQKNVETLPPPLIAATDAGEEYYPHLKKVETLLKKGDTAEFYHAVAEIYEMTEADRKIRELEGRPKFAKPDTVTWEWLGYYLARAPLFPRKAIGRTAESEKRRFSEAMSQQKRRLFPFQNFDINIKRHAYLDILTENLEEKAKLLHVDAKKLNTLHLRYLQTYLKSFAEGRDEWEKFTQEGLIEDEKEIKKVRQLLTTGKGDIEEGAYKAALLRKHDNASARNRRSTTCQSIIEFSSDTWAKRLIKSYPHDGASVRKNILDAGFSKEQCHKLLLETVEERNKETEYLFTDLPKLTPHVKKSATPPKK